jgi:hypothetical protein
LTRPDLLKERSRDMEAERRALGLHDIRFRYFACPRCGFDDVFLDVIALADESPDDFRSRRRELETLVRDLHAVATEVVVTERGHPRDRNAPPT